MPAVRDITDILNAMIPDMPRGKYEEILQTRAKIGTKFLFDRCRKERPASYALEQRLRVKPSNSARVVRPYQGFGASVDNYTVKVATDYIVVADKMAFNDIEDKITSSGRNRIISLYDVRRSALIEGIYNLIEPLVWGVPNSASELDGALWGFPYWFRRRATNSPDTDGGFNGQTIYYGNGSTGTVIGSGTTSATGGAVDAALPGNMGVRNWNVTYGGVFDLLAFKSVRRALLRTDFQMMDELKGTQSHGGEQRIFMPDDQYEQYMDLVDSGPDDNKGDMAKHSNYKLYGVKPTPVPQLNNDAAMPVYGAKSGHIEGCILEGEYMKDRKAVPDPNDNFTSYVTNASFIQMNVINPRAAGWVMSYAA